MQRVPQKQSKFDLTFHHIIALMATLHVCLSHTVILKTLWKTLLEL